MNGNEIIKFVQDNARFIDYDDEPYAILWKSESFWGESPRDLVEQILEFENEWKTFFKKDWLGVDIITSYDKVKSYSTITHNQK